MNNNYLKYFLIIAVIGVWAAIIIRVVKGMGTDTVIASPVQIRPVPASQDRTDTFGLYADYPDPFLPGADSADLDPPARAVAQSPSQPAPPLPNNNRPVPVTPEIVAALIQYNGTISNPQKRVKVAIITLQGKEYLVRERDRIGDVRIRKIEKDRVSIFYKGEPFTLQK